MSNQPVIAVVPPKAVLLYPVPVGSTDRGDKLQTWNLRVRAFMEGRLR